MKVLVCGGSEFGDWTLLRGTLDEVQPRITLVISGGARGADSFAIQWARQRGIACAVFMANWDHYGRAAGPVRNGWMVEFGKPDLVIAFPGGLGTANMIKQARQAGIPVKEIENASSL